MSALIRNRSYRLLFTATGISNLGDGVSALALPWLATLITRDATLIALVAFATRLPWFLLAIPAGAFVDRGDRKRLIVQADVFRTLLTAGIIALIFSVPEFPLGQGEAFYILALSALAFLLGSAEVLRDNAAQTLLPSVVAKADLETANGQLWSVEQVMGSFVGPPLAGVLIALAVPAPFLLDAVTFALATWLVWSIGLPPRIARKKRALLTEIAEGWQWMRSHPMVLRVAIILGLLNGAVFMALTVLVLVSQEVLNLSAFGHGVLLTAGAAGGVVGGLLGPRVVARMGAVNSVRLALVIFPFPYLVIGLTASPYLVGIALFFEMLAGLIWNIVTVSWRQRIIPDDILGRVNSLYRFFGWGIMPFGALAGGVIVSLAEPEFGREWALRAPYFAASLACVLLAIFGWRSIRI